MARLVIPTGGGTVAPSGATAKRVLPFLSLGTILEQGGAIVATNVPVTVWPATSSRTGPAGRHHSHSGEAALAYADALRRPNRSIVVEGATYKIVGATPMSFMPHVVLELNLTSGRA